VSRGRSKKNPPPGGLSPAQIEALKRGEDTFDASALYGALHAVVSISLTTRELEIINKVMETEGKSRSEAIRTLIRRGWAYTRLLEDEERLHNEPSA